MKERIINIFLALLCIACGVLCFFTYTRKDRVRPEIYMGSKILTYADLQDVNSLLNGVTAMDDKDGDVSDSLVVEGIYANAAKDSFRVVYAAEDRSGNVAKIEQIVFKNEDDESIVGDVFF